MSISVKDLIKPVCLGKFQIAPDRYLNHVQETGVTCLGLILDEANALVAGVLGGRSTSVDDFQNTALLWRSCQMKPPESEPISFAASRNDLVKYEWEDLDFGKLVLVIHKGALASQQVEALGDLPRFYCWAGLDNKTPLLPPLFEKLQRIIALPLDPEWYPALWDALVEKAFAVPCQNFGGFVNMWEVVITQNEWKQLVLSLVKEKRLP